MGSSCAALAKEFFTCVRRPEVIRPVKLLSSYSTKPSSVGICTSRPPSPPLPSILCADGLSRLISTDTMSS